MNLKTHALVAVVALSLGAGGTYLATPSTAPSWSVNFSPKGGCTEAVVNEVAKARKQVLVQAYSFTSKPIAQALIDAQGRGVDVQVLVDASDLGDSSKTNVELLVKTIPVFSDGAHPIAHNKVMVIDGATVITGSFNFTNQAEFANAENLLIVHDATLAKRFTDNWQIHRQHSTPVPK